MSGFNSSDAFTSGPALQARQRSLDEPLSLAVHGLPDPGDMLQQRRRSGRWKMLAVLLVCAAPVLASYFTYYVLRPTQQRSFGELIADQPGLPAVQGQTLDGRSVDLQSLKGQWLLLSTGSGACAERCQDNLYLQRQLREALGREKDRLDWVWLVSDGRPVPETILPALDQATALRVPTAAIEGWLRPQAGHALDEHLYVVDPQGHWMMRFPAAMDKAAAGRAKRDLERLLRASASWDEAGRTSPATGK
jgi:hypothetical protein